MNLLLGENHGFLPTRGSLMLDFVFVAMFGIVPILAYSIYAVKYRGRFQLHKTIQIALGAVLLVAVAAFEIDVQFFNDWEVLAAESRFFTPGSKWNNPVGYSLAIHLFFAIPTAFLWVYVIVQAVRKFPRPPAPGEHSRQHKFWARLAAIEMFLTAVTGWIFYVLAFVM